MKPTDRIALISLGVGVIVAGLFYRYLVDDAPWWCYAIIALFVFSMTYGAGIDVVSKERLVDRDHRPR